MYRTPDRNQMTVYDFVLPFGGHLDPENRWVKLHDEIDWAFIDEIYGKQFETTDVGNEAYSAELAFGSLYIQQTIKCQDRELVQQISENPYMQYFIGRKEFSTEKPFDPSLLVHFRKRFTAEVMAQINEHMFIKKTYDDGDNDDHNNNGSDGGAGDSQKADVSKTGSKNKGTVIIDATCTPADIAFPTDLELCDKARHWTEVILDHYWLLYGSLDGSNVKPRTYREAARKRFLNLNKRRKKSSKKIRKELRYQLNCINRNIKYIESYVLEYGFESLFKIEIDRLLTIFKFYEQQRYMLDNKVHTVDDRIVSLSQPWVRPIVRGKSKTPTEFGAKISISVVNGFTFIDKISFDAYNEGEHDEFVKVIERYKKRFGHYPERVLADKIYRSQANRKYCKELGIKISGPRLGRRGKSYTEELRQELKEIGERNAVEGKFGNGKRKLGMDLIMAKLKETSESVISMDVFVLNMELRMRRCVALCYGFFKRMLCHWWNTGEGEYMGLVVGCL